MVVGPLPVRLGDGSRRYECGLAENLASYSPLLNPSAPSNLSLAGIPVIEAAFGRNISADVEIHDLAGTLKMVRPLEIDRCLCPTRGQAQCLSRDRELQFIAFNPNADR